jgi:2-methylisocitrate lyase-like PEP mutase family enzyme
MSDSLREKALRLRELHHGDRILVLPNVWDAGSARLVEQAGYPAIATTSAGIAFTYGLPDGQLMSRAQMLEAVSRITSAVSVPVTADLEAGYGDVVATVQGMLEAGAVGLNLEDTDGDQLVAVDEQVRRIQALRQTASTAGVPVVLNARCDIFLAAIGPAETRLDRTLERLQAYTEAGADSLFVPGVVDEHTISRLVRGVSLPLNILATSGAPPVARLEELGVRRVSMGSGPARAAMSMALLVAEELRDTGTYTSFTSAKLSYAAAQKAFAPR